VQTDRQVRHKKLFKSILTTNVMLNLFQHLSNGCLLLKFQNRQTLKAAKLQFKYTTQESSTQLRALALQGDNYCKGFTLAEVLLVITVIGIVASYTIPPLAISVQKQRYTTALLKNYSVVANAYKLLDADGTTMEAALPGTDNGAAALNKIAPKLNIIKNCGSSMGCFYNSPQYLLNGTVNSSDWDTALNNYFGKAILADGTMILIQDLNGSYPNCSGSVTIEPPLNKICGAIIFDVNGAKVPNTYGRDMFYFWITKTGLYPFGNGDGYVCTSGGDGIGCASTVITQGMNY
jgi:prepilin-type N-terminal cleavage/methylation domain-containing protein